MLKGKAYCGMTLKSFKCAIANSYDGIMVADNKGKILYYNEAYGKLSGIPDEKLWGRTVRDIINDGYLNRSAVLMALEQKAAVVITQHYADRISAMVAATPVFDEKGDIETVVLNVRDFAELSSLKHSIERAEKAMADFCAEFKNVQNEYGENIIAVSSCIKEAFSMAEKISKVDVNTLLIGEKGVGKNVMAKYIHDKSVRTGKSFVAIDCSAVQEQLLEPQLFGYMDGGAKGGAKGGKQGVFESAIGGTVFLEGICDISTSMQAKLLRVLETRTVIRVGSRKPIPIDVRIIAATHRNIMQMIKAKEFREDLYYKLNAVKIEIPPLRERHDDIIPLSLFYLDYFNKQYKLNKKMTPIVLNELKNHTWYGNIQELKNVIERVVVTSYEDELKAHDLSFGTKDNDTVDFEESQASSCNEIMSLAKAVELTERKLLIQAKNQFASTRAMANALGVDHSTIIRKMKKYEL